MNDTKEKVILKVKEVGAIACGVGAQAISCGVLRAILPPGINAIVQGGICLGGTLLGAMLGEMMGDYVDRKIDYTAKCIEETAENVKRSIEILQDKDIEGKTQETENKE